ncbi:MAG: hypothetical protein HYZ44_03265 [Bacteroidetes bacterium]|nr:hypothetical protein [Bacteroidota bacterium]
MKTTPFSSLSFSKKLAFVLTVFVMGFTSCRDSKEVELSGKCVKVKLVSVLCGQAVLHIEDQAAYSLGETWNNQANVFFAVFDCSVNEQAIANTTFYVELQTNPFQNDTCYRCMAAIDYTGEKKYYVRVSTKCGGGSTE